MLLQCYPCVEILYRLKKNCKKEANILFGNIIGIRDTVGFHGESVGELKDAFQEAIDFYLSIRNLHLLPRHRVAAKS